MKKFLIVVFSFTLLLSLVACGGKMTPSSSDDTPISSQNKESTGSDNSKEDVEKPKDEDKQDSNEEDEKAESSNSSSENGEKNTPSKDLVDGMRPEFKEAMDSYEAFYDEYCNFMKKYNENPSDMELLAEYTDMIAKSAEATKKFEAWEDDDGMNNTELKYYLEVNNRIMQKLLEVSE